MPRVTNADQIALILRAKLQKTSVKKTQGTPKPPKAEKKSAIEKLSELLARDSSSNDNPEVAKALVKAILEEEFGIETANDPSFVAISDKVHEFLQSQDSTKELLIEATSDVSRL